MTASDDPYAGLILKEIPRVLGLLDREPDGPTSGCADRAYWAWKFVDFPGARFQEAVCALAFVHSQPGLAGNPYEGSPRLLEWIDRALRFWAGLQRGDGSFDEAYPRERSLAATAFTVFYVAEALESLGGALADSTVQRCRDALARAGSWLLGNDESHGFLSNHLAAAAGALLHVGRITGETRFNERSRYFLEKILAHQSPEGWYEEYGGADPGYQTHGTFYLARCWELNGNDALLDSLARANAFLAHFIHPDGSLGGAYGSRNTQTYYPAGFEMLAPYDASAAWIAATQRPLVGRARAAELQSIDVQNLFPMLNNLTFAWRGRRRAPKAPVEPGAADALAWFPEAGLARYRTELYDAYVGVTKGGVVQVFDRNKGRLLLSDAGYLGRTRRGMRVSTQQQGGSVTVEVSAAGLSLRGAMYRVARPVMTPWRLMLLRTFMGTVGRFGWAARWVKRRLAQTLVRSRRRFPVTFERRVTCSPEGLVITDALRGAGLSSLRQLPAFTTIHMGSARYFVAHELEGPPDEVHERWDGAEVERGLTVERRLCVERA